MKNLFYSVLCAVSILFVSSCGLGDENNTSESSNEVKTIVVLPDTVKQKIVEQDSLMKALVSKIDELTSELNKSKEEIVELKKSVESLESPKNPWGYMTLAAIVLAIIAIVLVLLKSNGVKEERVNDIVKRCFDESSKIKDLQTNVNNMLSAQRNSRYNLPNATSQNIEYDIQQLKVHMKQVLSIINTQQTIIQQQGSNNRKEPSMQLKEPQYETVGYAKIDTDMYFTTIYDSNQEGCVFKINFTSPTKGKFTIISLDKIQSRNDWQKKVECSGISIKDASDFRVEDDGICEKIDENTWKVTKPLKIRLLK